MAETSNNLNLFSSRLKSRRFDEMTLRILELIMSSSKDVNLSLNLRSTLVDFIRSESLTVIRENADNSIQLKLIILDFFVRAFAIVDDLESCLSLRYEGLVLRDSSLITHPELQVSCDEWMNFAEDAFDNAFHSVAAKACENAVLCFNRKGDTSCDNFYENTRSIDEVQRLKDVAILLSSNHSVQAQAAQYLKKKTSILKQSLSSKEAEYLASISFTTGIKLHNERNLMRLKNQKLL